MIDDRMEEGLSEDEAVSAVGFVDEIVAQIVADIPLTKLVKEKTKLKKRLRAWEIVLLVLGAYYSNFTCVDWMHHFWRCDDDA